MKYFCVALILMAVLVISNSQIKAEDMAIHKGSKVAFDYTLLVDDKVKDTSEGRAPLEYTQGDGRLIPGLTRQMEGLKVGDERTIEVKPEEGYGTPDPNAFKEMPIRSLPSGIKPEVGMILQARDANGRIMPMTVAKINKETVLMDFNHPLAGKALIFKIKIVSVK